MKVVRNDVTFPIPIVVTAWALLGSALASGDGAQVAGKPRPQDLTIATRGQSAATVAISPDAGPWEKRAAADLVYYIQRMTGAKPKLADTPAGAIGNSPEPPASIRGKPVQPPGPSRDGSDWSGEPPDPPVSFPKGAGHSHGLGG